MVQLVMDQDSKGYKVLVMGHPKKQSGSDAVARIFNSVIGKWSEPNNFSDLIFGHQHSNHGMVTGKKGGPCTYDCASNTLLELHDNHGGSNGHIKQVLMKDRLFKLARFEVQCLLTEYQVESCTPHFFQPEEYDCLELDIKEYDDWLETQFWGCQDFLLVNVYEFDDDESPQ